MKKLLRNLSMLALMIIGGAQTAWAETHTVKSWPFTTLSWNTSTGFGSSTIKINRVDCKYCIGALEGLALQDASWTVNKNGLMQGNGGRNIAILDLKGGDIVKITTATTLSSIVNGTGDTYTGECTFTVTADGAFGFNTTRNAYISNIEVLREIKAGVCESPTYKLAAANTSRKFTLSCGTPNSVIYYSETEKTAEDEGWTKYTSEVTTNAETIYAYAKTDDANSDVISFATGAGTEIQLNAPVITRISYSAGNYSVSFYSTQTDLPIIPSSVTYSYSIDGGDAQTGNSATIPEGSTITVSTISDGYANSDATAWATSVRPTLIDVWKEDYTNLTSATGNGAYGVVLSSEVAFSCNEKEFKNITGYNSGTTVDVTVTTNVGLSTNEGFYLRCNGSNSGILQNTKDAYLGIDNLEPGQMIVITSSAPLTADYGLTYEDGMSTATEYYFTATETTASILVTKGTYNYVKTISVKKPGVSISLPADYVYSTFCSEFDLDFTDNADVEAYIAYGDGENVILKQVNRVPGETGLVLKKLGDATSATVPVTQILESTEEEEKTLSLNALRGVLDEPVSAEDLIDFGAYILEDDYKFSKVVEGATGKVAVGKAILMYPSISPQLNIKIFDGEATAIKGVEVKAAQADNAIYNLQGVRVSKPTAKGLYIINGKKHLCK